MTDTDTDQQQLIGSSHKEHWHVSVQRLLDDWDGKYLITSPDVDGVLSALIVMHHYPATRLIGLYDTERLLLFGASTTWQDAREALWVDLDVLRGVRCIGQHLIQKESSDAFPTRHALSFNPNIHFVQTYFESFRGRNEEQRRDKYPFGTVHMLMDFFGITDPQAYVQPLMVHADGAWINAVKYSANCRIWANGMFRPGVLDALFTYTTAPTPPAAPSHLEAHAHLVQQLKALTGPCMGHTRTNCSVFEKELLSEPWLALKGNQSIECPDNGDVKVWVKHFERVWNYAIQETGWTQQGRAVDFTIGLRQKGTVNKIEHFPTRHPKPKKQHQYYPAPPPYQTLDKFTAFAEVFSFAIILRNTLRFTCDIDLAWPSQEEETIKATEEPAKKRIRGESIVVKQ